MVMTTADSKSAQVDFSYDPVGRLGSLRRTADGDASTTITTAFTRDLLDRVTGITHSKVSGGEEVATILSQFGYSYDASSRVVGSTGPEGALSFALDTSGQLLSVTGCRSENYAYDPVGNRSAYITAEGNLILNDGQFTYSHDLEGNLKTKTRLSDGQVTEYYWDHCNQLTKAVIKNASGAILKELRFTYDVEGRRVGEWVDADGAGPGNPDQVWTVYDGANPYMDFDAQGNVKERYLYGPGVDELFARIGAGEDPQWYLTDRLGSVRQIVDAEGSILDVIVYDSFGNVLSESNPSQGDRFKFTGREYSQELGIYYYRARWYDPATGQFISQDPIGFSAGDPNLYRYVGNAPGDATDPEGLQTTFYESYLEKRFAPPIAMDEDPFSGLVLFLVSIARSEECKKEAVRIGKAISNTYSNNWRPHLPRWTDDRRKGFYCDEWAYAFEDAIAHERKEFFLVKVKAVYCDEDIRKSLKKPRVHFYIELICRENPDFKIYIDDGFGGGKKFYGKDPPLPYGYKTFPGPGNDYYRREGCNIPATYDSNGHRVPR